MTCIANLAPYQGSLRFEASGFWMTALRPPACTPGLHMLPETSIKTTAHVYAGKAWP